MNHRKEGDYIIINIDYSRMLFSTPSKNIIICEGEINGSKCYVVKHEKRSHLEIIDYDTLLIDAVIRKAKNENTLTIATYQGMTYFKFKESSTGKSISLRRYVYAIIHGFKPEDTYNMRIDLIDNTLRKDNILDIRRINLKHSGADSMEGLEVLCRPEIASEKYLLVEKDNTISIQEYSEGLLSIFKNHTLCNISSQRDSTRQLIKIKTGNGADNYITTNLAKFTLIYNQSFIPKFECTSDSITQFTHDYPELVSAMGDLQCAHINACTWNNCINNTLFMTGQANRDMSDLIKYFTGRYDAFAISYQMPTGSHIILVEINYGFGNKFYICDTPELYADLQKSYLGRTPALRDTRFIVVDTEKNASATLETPREAFYKHGKQQEPVGRDAIIEAFWNWCDHRDKLIALFLETPNAFQKWNPMIVGNGIRLDSFLKNISSGSIPKGILLSAQIN